MDIPSTHKNIPRSRTNRVNLECAFFYGTDKTNHTGSYYHAFIDPRKDKIIVKTTENQINYETTKKIWDTEK